MKLSAMSLTTNGVARMAINESDEIKRLIEENRQALRNQISEDGPNVCPNCKSRHVFDYRTSRPHPGGLTIKLEYTCLSCQYYWVKEEEARY